MSPRIPRFVTLESVLRLHALAIEDQGGDPAIRDMGLLESALAQPRAQFGGEFLHPTIPAMAAAYAFHICKNHPFIDGNKRAATAAMIKFLSDNGWSFDATADQAEPAILDLAAGGMGKEQFTQWLTGHCHEKPSLELREFLSGVRVGTVEQFLHTLNLERTSNEEVEATIREASASLPIIAGFLTRAEFAGAENDAVGKSSMLNAAMIFVALFRLAEDMGYEW